MYPQAATLALHTRRLTALFAFICALSAFCYGTFLLLAVERTATLAKTEAQIHSVSSELSSLENRYLVAEETLTPQRAQELGFVEPAQSAQAFVSTNSRVLTFNDVGR